MNHHPIGYLLATFGIMLAALPAHADTTCPPNPSLGSTVNDNLIVPPGQQCTLAGVTVTGNVQVQSNAFLSVNKCWGSTIID